MKNHQYTLFSPGGNDTALVENRDSSIDRSDYPRIAQEIMTIMERSCEQVGFIEKATLQNSDGRLHMMGGEFCVNALRSLAMQLRSETNRDSLRLESSGLTGTISLEIKGNGVEVALTPGQLRRENALTIVKIPGITHFVEKVDNLPSQEAQGLSLSTILDTYKEILEGVQAVGYIPYTQKEGAFVSQPLIYVVSTDTKIYETGCGSGSLAVFQDLALAQAEIIQPSGYSYELTRSDDVIKLFSPVIKLGGDCVSV